MVSVIVFLYAKHQAAQLLLAFDPQIECFHSRDEQPYWTSETKESICIKIEFQSRRISLVHYHDRHFFILERPAA